MEFGIALPHFYKIASPENIARVARRAEELGFEGLWVTDHVLLTGAVFPTFGPDFYDPISTLAYTAAITSRIRIGSSVFVLPYRSGIVTAKSLATIDVLSHGRLDVGVGAGGVPAESQALGVPFETRGELVDETLEVFKVFWTSPNPEFAGKYYNFSGVHFDPKPVQKPHPPIWVGGNSKRAVRRAVEYGNVWVASGTEPNAIAEGAALLRRLAERRGRNPAEIRIGVRLGFKILDTPSAQAPRMLIGTKDQVLEQIGRYQQAGVSHFVVDLFYRWPELLNETMESVLAAMERLTNEIRPRIQG